jgi:hypothetical protein
MRSRSAAAAGVQRRRIYDRSICSRRVSSCSKRNAASFGVGAGGRGNFRQARFLLGREMDFHRFRLR